MHHGQRTSDHGPDHLPNGVPNHRPNHGIDHGPDHDTDLDPDRVLRSDSITLVTKIRENILKIMLRQSVDPFAKSDHLAVA